MVTGEDTYKAKNEEDRWLMVNTPLNDSLTSYSLVTQPLTGEAAHGTKGLPGPEKVLDLKERSQETRQEALIGTT